MNLKPIACALALALGNVAVLAAQDSAAVPAPTPAPSLTVTDALIAKALVQLREDLLLRLRRAHIVAVNNGTERVVLLIEAIRVSKVVLRRFHVDLNQLLLDRSHLAF